MVLSQNNEFLGKEPICKKWLSGNNYFMSGCLGTQDELISGLVALEARNVDYEARLQLSVDSGKLLDCQRCIARTTAILLIAVVHSSTNANNTNSIHTNNSNSADTNNSSIVIIRTTFRMLWFNVDVGCCHGFLPVLAVDVGGV